MTRPLTLTFAQPFIDIPRDIGEQLFARIGEIIETLNGISRGSTVWESLVESWLVLRIRDWRFHYRIDTHKNQLVVMAASRREDSGDSSAVA